MNINDLNLQIKKIQAFLNDTEKKMSDDTILKYKNQIARYIEELNKQKKKNNDDWIKKQQTFSNLPIQEIHNISSF